MNISKMISKIFKFGHNAKRCVQIKHNIICRGPIINVVRSFGTEGTPKREAMEYDVVVVGGGPAGLTAAIRLKQIEEERGKEISVCVVEKGAEIGSHIISGNVFETKALDELFPNWKEMGALGEEPTKAAEDSFVFMLNEKKGLDVPKFLIPKSLDNHDNYIISLNELVRWLGEQATELGVEIYPGFPADEVLYDKNDQVIGIATKDVGISKDGTKKENFERGVELRAKQTLFAEGCRGSCSEEIINKYKLRKGKDMQSYGLGIKEVWKIPDENHKPGYIQHTFGWPLDTDTYGGSFMYHMKPNLILIGFVIGLDYKNPYMNPYKEFQRFKHHPKIKKHLKGGECISYGARCINEGGLQAIPKLTFPGGALIGCSAGFLNVPKVKGTHTAMKSGMVAAESVFELLQENGRREAPNTSNEVTNYQTLLEKSWVYSELSSVRNCAPSFKWGLFPGIVYSFLSGTIFKGSEPWTFSKHGTKRDSEFTQHASCSNKIDYPKPDGVLSFDILTNLQRSGTNHQHDQPSHLQIQKHLAHVPNNISITKYDGPEQRFCPAKVYEYQHNNSDGKKELIINSQNCIHCKCCSIKMPHEYIKWTTPEGPGGPSYNNM